MRILLAGVLMLKLSSAYGATWSAAFGDHKLKYNEKVWSLVSELHDPEDTFFALIDKSDGTTFYVRIEAVDHIDEIADESIELSLEEGISDEKFQAEWVGKSKRSISGITFTLVKYRIMNPKFGKQIVANAYARKTGEVVIIMLAWPYNLPVIDSGLPAKLEALIDGVTLAADG